MPKRTRSDLPVIGWREWIGLPDLSVDRIKVKVDTGARTSSLHAFGLKTFERDGTTWARFEVHPVQRSKEPSLEVEAEVQEFRSVRPSTGKASRRPVIITRATLLGRTWPIEVTLASRDAMGFRMLLGREALHERFLVDVASSFRGGKAVRGALAKRR